MKHLFLPVLLLPAAAALLLPGGSRNTTAQIVVATLTPAPAPTGTPTAVPPVATPPSGTPAPSATATPTPSPQEVLLVQAEAASRARGSAHVIQTNRITLPGIDQQTSRLEGDLSFTAASLSVTVKATDSQLDRTPAVIRSTQQQLILVGNKLAVRSGSQAWQCNAAADLAATPGSLLASLTPGNGVTVKADAHPTAHVGTVPVAVVDVTIPLPALGTSTAVRVFIAQTDQTVVQEVAVTHASARVRWHGQLKSISTTTRSVTKFSQYGHRVSIAYPKGCP